METINLNIINLRPDLSRDSRICLNQAPCLGSAFIFMEVIMAIRKVFYDEDGQELTVSLNAENQIFITVGNVNHDNEWIMLTKEDVPLLIAHLEEFYKKM